MKNSEHGFTYPLTLCLLILFLASFSFYVERCVIEKKISSDTAENLTTEYYVHSSLKKIELTLLSTGSIPATGTYYFQNGIVAFQAESPASTSQTVNLTLSLPSGISISGKGIYDLPTRKLMKWTE